MSEHNNNFALGAFLTMFGGACWGISGSVGQYLFTAEGMDSRWLVPVRLGLAGLLLFLWGLRKEGSRVFAPWRTAKDRRELLIYGLAGVSMCQFLYFLTIQLSSAAIATILQDLSPVLIMIAECSIDHRFPSVKEVLAVILALTGVFLLSTHGDPAHLAIPASALVTGVLSAVCVTIYNVCPRQLLKTYPVYLLQCWAFLLGSLFFSILFQAWSIPVTLTWRGVLGILFAALVGNILAFTCYMQGVRRIGPSRSILFAFSEPLTAAIITVVCFHQPVTLYDFTGFALIFGMILLISEKDRP